MLFRQKVIAEIEKTGNAAVLVEWCRVMKFDEGVGLNDRTSKELHN